MTLPKKGPPLSRLRYGISAAMDAWLLHFFTENNLEYSIDQEKNASPEQIRFMVALEDERAVYAPFEDKCLDMFLDPEKHKGLYEEYCRQWGLLIRLVQDFVPDKEDRRRILLLCGYKFRQLKASTVMLPSRVMKLFLSIFLSQSGITDPYQKKKAAYNSRAWSTLHGKALKKLLDQCPKHLPHCHSLLDYRTGLDMLELSRLLFFSTKKDLWEKEDNQDILDSMAEEELCHEKCCGLLKKALAHDSRHILYIPDTSGGIIFDLILIKALIRQGHRVTLALKEGFYFDSPTFWDWEQDSVLHDMLEDAWFLSNGRVGKNQLLKAQHEHPLLIISDGTREELNLYRCSTTFARAWKESDLIMAKGIPQYKKFMLTSQEFTRDIFCFYQDRQERFQVHFKERAASVLTFTVNNLKDMADNIIAKMRRAKGEGKTILFYSAIIGSIPGQTSTALKLVDAFVRHLRSKLEDTLIINPGEYFEQGMDADDLMFMWERVQRSGLLHVWRFQTVTDIETSFELLGRKIPPLWAGKDSTFSTGCTKEMRIALEMQQTHPEMQIIGPGPDKFFRRSDYGVGKFSDEVLD